MLALRAGLVAKAGKAPYHGNQPELPERFWAENYTNQETKVPVVPKSLLKGSNLGR